MTVMKAALFADVHNLYYCTNKKFNGKKLDYKFYLDFANEKIAEVTRAFAYGFQKETEAVNFITCLRKIGFDCNFKRPRVIGSGENQFHKTDWNVGICVDVVKILDRVEAVIIGSSDPELVPLINYLKFRGIQTIIYSAMINKELKEVADRFYEIDSKWLEKAKEEEPQEVI